MGILFAGMALGHSVPCMAQTEKGNGYAAYSTAAKDPPFKIKLSFNLT